MTSNIVKKDYKNWLKELKQNIKNRQIKAAMVVNEELIKFYWDLGKGISEKQTVWGSGFINQLSKDLKTEFPDLSGFSRTNLIYCRKFYLFYNQEEIIVQQLVGQIDGKQIEWWEQLIPKIPWGHHILILNKIDNVKEAIFYISETMENNWSRSVLEYQIESGLYERQGKAITNFSQTLPKPDSDLANQLIKDPYNFDFLSLTPNVLERDLEKKLINNITQFLLELGKGFAYLGRQYLLKVGEREFRTDLLFYHTKLKCYIIIELKTTDFEPEYVGKLNFYINAVDELLKADDDKQTIGILLCKHKDKIVVDFSLKDVNKPIGVSEFTYNQLPKEIKKLLPSEKEFKKQLSKVDND